jgi:hypothetical protein
MGRAVWVSGDGGVNGGTCASGAAVTARGVGRGRVRERRGVGCGASGDEWCIELGYWGGGGYLQLQQSYGYDGLNRLTTFGETVTAGGSSSGGSWGHTNWYERWRNRWATGTLPQGMVTPSWAWAIDAGTNRVVTGFNNAAIWYTASGEMKRS